MLSRLTMPLLRFVGRSWHVYPLGFVRPGLRYGDGDRPARFVGDRGPKLGDGIRHSLASDNADVVAFLASNVGRWATGQMVDATGGSHL
nr:hypothetical protein [Cohnella thermotolerans]